MMKIRLKYIWAILALMVFATSAPAFDGESQFAKLDGAQVHYKSYGKG
jgi:hypothetical protein